MRRRGFQAPTDRAGGTATATTRTATPRAPAVFVGRAAELQRFADAMIDLRLAVVYGVAGAGKTAFMLRAAEQLAARQGAHVLYHQCRPGDSVATVARATIDQAAGTPSRIGDPVDMLAELATVMPAVLCLDDAHRLDDVALVDAAAHLAARRLPLWLCVASRETLPLSPLAIDHLVVRLASLSEEDARLLWTTLERLYGPPHGAHDIEGLLARGPTPLSLKRLFAGSGGTDDALGLGELPPAARRLLTLACAYRRAMPLSALAPGSAAEDAEAALRELARRFLVESATPDAVGLHDVVREAVLRSVWAPGRDDHARCLAYYRAQLAAQPGNEDVELEVLFHAVAAGDDPVALAILGEHASRFVRLPPGSPVVDRELALAIDVIGTRRPVDAAIRRLRERIRARHGDVQEAFVATKALAGSDPAVEYDLADMAFSLGRLDDAIAHATRAADDPELNPLMRALAVGVVADAYRQKGALDEAERTLSRCAPFGVVGAAIRACTRAIWAHDYQRYGEAARLVAEGRRALAELTIPVGLPLVASLERALAAALGTRERQREGENAGELYDETVFFRCVARLMRTEELLFAGEGRRAAELADDTRATALARGFGTLAAWGDWLWAHAQLLLGQPRLVTARAEAALAQAEAAGYPRAAAYLDAALARSLLLAGELVRAQELAQRAAWRCPGEGGTRGRLHADLATAAWLTGDAAAARLQLSVRVPCEGYDAAEHRLAVCEGLLWEGALGDAIAAARAIATSCDAAGWRWLLQRARLLVAEAQFRQGEIAAAAAALDLLRAEVGREGYAVERARAALLDAAVARAAGDTARATEALTCARRDAAAAGLEVEAAAAMLALEHVASGVAAPRAASSAVVPPAIVAAAGARLARRVHLDRPVTLRIRDANGASGVTDAHAAEWRFDRCDALFDLAHRKLKLGTRSTDLGHRAALVEVLRALLARPGETTSAAELVQAAWGVDYHPLRHHSRVTTTMSRLRALLGPSVVEGSRAGYRLRLPARWAVLEPA